MIKLPSYIYLQNESYKYQSDDFYTYVKSMYDYPISLFYLIDSICKN